MTLSEHHIANFKQNYLPRLREKYKVLQDDDTYIITTCTFGILDFNAGKNYIWVRNRMKFYEPGLKWIISNLLKK